MDGPYVKDLLKVPTQRLPQGCPATSRARSQREGKASIVSQPDKHMNKLLLLLTHVLER